MASQRGMGRGLAAILTVAAREEEDELRTLPVDLIAPNPDQPRKAFDKTALLALAESLKSRGVLQPVLVRPVAGGTYELVTGERRWRAARLAGLEELPALIRERDDAAALEAALVENVAREDLNPVEEARAVAALVEELALTREEVGRRIGRSRVAVSNLLRILDLPDDALDLLETGALTEGHGRALLLASDHAERRRLGREAALKGWSVRELETQARRSDQRGVGTRGRRGETVHPDLEDALARAADALGAALGTPDVKVVPKGRGCRVEISLESLDDALALVDRVARLAPSRAISSVG